MLGASINVQNRWKHGSCAGTCPQKQKNYSLPTTNMVKIWLYEGRLISNAHSEIFCQRSKIAMRVQCVLVATTLLHNGAKFHSFLYTGSKTVHVSMESCYGGMSTRLKQRAVTEFLNAENGTTVNRWAIKFCECEPGHANIVDQPHSGRPVSMKDDKHQKQVDELIKHGR